MRIGGVPYGVGAPLLEGLDEDPEVEFRRDPPTDLARMLREEVLDAALLSSIEGYRHPGYRADADLCIASRGPTRSVRAFVREGPIRTVALDSGSASSVALLRILLSRELLGPCDTDLDFTAVPPTARPDDLPHDAVMMIGDCGLNATTATRRSLDLGELWFDWTGLPMVYAIWLLTPNADAQAILPRLHEARRASVAAAVGDGTGGAVYYTMGDRERAGLQRFHEEAAALDLADPSIRPVFLSVDDAGGKDS